MPETPENAPVQVLMPVGLLTRMESWLAMTGMRLYRVPVKDDLATFLVGVDMAPYAEPAPDGTWPVNAVAEAYRDAVAYLAEVKPKASKPKRKARKDVA